MYYLKRIAILSTWGIKRLLKKEASRSEDTMIVGTHAEYYPFEFIENDIIQGFDIDLIQQIACKIGKKIEIKNMPFESLIPAIQVGSIHLIAAGMTPTEDRAKKVFFSKSYLSNDPLLIVTLSDKSIIKDIKELIGRTVAVNQGYTADFYISKIDGINLKRFETITDAFLALKSGQVHSFVTAKNSAQPFFEKYGTTQFYITLISGTEETYAFAISKKHPKLLDTIQDAQDEMKQDGSLDALKKKWKLQ